jgi:1-deoxy-D-xylulose-5-phosphate synthase
MCPPALPSVREPDALRQLPPEQLPGVAADLRQFVLNTVAGSGGHFGASLGCIELTVALHYCYDTPKDRLIWDVGHQAHAHKALTKRADGLAGMRQRAGLAPFPSRDESSFDAFGAGHASTSISAALGMALASQSRAEPRRHVAIIGDGGLTGGMAWEALQHLGACQAPVLVVINENRMSISENVGQLVDVLKEPDVRGLAETFHTMGLQYHGPVDGHDLEALITQLTSVRDAKGPQVLHIRTQKGRGYSAAEADPVGYHAVPVFDPAAGKTASSGNTSWSAAAGQWLCQAAERREDLHVITPAMKEGSGLVKFAQQHPRRFHDVAIAEQHAATLAAGLAAGGEHPVLAIYSTFLQRAMDQVIHDIALQKLAVTLLIDRAGLVGGDGATHQGVFDISLLRAIPNIEIVNPSDAHALFAWLDVLCSKTQPTAVRIPRGNIPDIAVADSPAAAPWHCEVELAGTHAVLTTGPMLHRLAPICQELGLALYHIAQVKPLPEEGLRAIAAKHSHWSTVEEHAVAGGLGSSINEWLAANDANVAIRNRGVPDRFIGHGSHEENLEEAGIDDASLRQWLNANTRK